MSERLSERHAGPLTYDSPYESHIMDLKLKIIYEHLLDARLLDVGCGTTEPVFRRVGRVLKRYVGIDCDLPKHRKGDNFEFVPTTLEEYESEEKFDVVLLFGTYEECPDPDRHLQLAAKHLDDGGSIFLSVPNPWALNRLMGVCNRFIEDPQELDYADVLQGHRRLHTIEQVVEAVERNGLEVKEYWPTGFKPLPLSEMPPLKKYWHQWDNLMKFGKEFGLWKYCAGWLVQAVEKK
ncbi:MAG: class I SAM-dependent methyltransferase [Promethearchaeota archaeon]